MFNLKSIAAQLNLDEEEVAACLTAPKQAGRNQRTGDVVNRLTDKYPKAYRDFYGSGTACVFKSGPDWRRICHDLDSVGVTWTSINPLAYAYAGEAKPFCPLILSIGVKPQSLLYDAAVAAATVVKNILAEASFPAIEVAFVESVVTRHGSVAAGPGGRTKGALGPKLLSFDPLLDDVPELRRLFTATLGLSIAPLKYPHLEGTASLYFRLGKDDKRIAVLTCAHVARSPPVYANTGMTCSTTRQAREEFVALGDIGYNNAVKAMMSTISNLLCYIDIWNDALDRLGKPVEGENTGSKVTKRRAEHLKSVAAATKKIEEVKAIHDEVTKPRATPDQRIIGFVLHSEKFEVSLYDAKINWPTYVGGYVSFADFHRKLFPQLADLANYQYPPDGLLQAYGVVQEDEIHKPEHLDFHGEKSLLVVKNGLATGTTVGRANGLESFIRIYDDYGVGQTSIEIAVLPYDETGKFSDAGDSGSLILARDGRIVGILTGGAGPADKIDISYLTPYWWVEQQINCFLYEVVQ
ncbi:uncharacterized protein B0H18DRAFT_1083548 [Fomitopsis serialis]|uniref:uncharacterized protein n=1 Tax=Fomitopsis serialis TaxID=139415 RepID=UPI002007E335|nr:uncharacterized protein B0H18DRAFT_1083548 [Neoantrodia serialis]KAH9931246.1 hypothetical protein B0H18DRAFT_1083548 [Neoantrodia serialis]